MQPAAYGTSLDYTIIIVYLVLIFGLGAVLSRFNKTTDDFFMGGQRFGTGVIALSLVATLVGSYSFIKYAAMAYQHGVSATMSYLNDWFWMPLFMFIWLPIIFYGRIRSVPEYFARRFDGRARAMATTLLLLYMVGYIGINLLTMGKIGAQLLGYEQTLGPVFLFALVVAVVCAAYVTSGGQAAVILSDVLQGVLLLFAGFWLLALGIDYLGGFDKFWTGLTPVQKLPLAPFNHPPDFNFIGIFWQDAVTQGVVVYFLNQGLMLRFLSGRSVDTGRKAVMLVLLFLQILAAVAVAGGGWIGRAMETHGLLPGGTKPDEIFMVVSHILCSPGVFGFILAALTAALMSTADTLINATASVWVNDVWRLYVRPNAPDSHHLRVGRIVSVAAAGIGIAMVPIYFQIGTIYQAHGAFTAAIGPPMAVAVVLGFLWRRFTAAAAFWTMLGGLVAVLLSFPFPELIAPFANGVEQSENIWKAYSFQRALFGLAVSFTIGVVVTLVSRPPKSATLEGLVAGTTLEAQKRFKGSADPKPAPGPKVKARVQVVPTTATQEVTIAGRSLERHVVWATPELARKLAARPGDVVILADARFLLSDLRGGQALLQAPPAEMDANHETIYVSESFAERSQLGAGVRAVVQRIL